MDDWVRVGRILIFCIGVLLAPSQASALQYDRVQLEPDVIGITAKGPIVPGDAARLSKFLDALPESDRIRKVSANDPFFEPEKAEHVFG